MYTDFKDIWLYEIKLTILEPLVYVFSLEPSVIGIYIDMYHGPLGKNSDSLISRKNCSSVSP